MMAFERIGPASSFDRRGGRVRGFWLIAMCVAAVPLPVCAQQIDALRMVLGDNDIAPTDSKGVVLVHRLGTCLALQHTDALSVLPRSDQSKNQLFDLATGGGCVSWQDSIRYSPMYLRGPIAESYLEAIESKQKLPRKAVRIYAEPTSDEMAKLKPDVRTAVALVAVGSCVDKSEHEMTMRVFETQPDSDGEGQALANLTGTLSTCIPPGIQLKFSKFILRGVLAEGAFRNAIMGFSAGK